MCCGRDCSAKSASRARSRGFTYSIELQALKQRGSGRTVAFAHSAQRTTFNVPCVVFQPHGACRRMIVLLEEKARAAGLFLICVNRPGQFGTSRPSEASGGSKPAAVVSAVVSDVVAVLDQLHVEQASILCFSTGTPLALAFAAMHPTRVTGQFVGIASWMAAFDVTSSPSDKKNRRKSLLPPYLVQRRQPRSSLQIDDKVSVKDVRKLLNKEEQDAFDARIGQGNDQSKWLRMVQWSLCEAHMDTVLDKKMLLAGAGASGVDYTKLKAAGTNITLYHGTDDEDMPLGWALAFANQVGAKVERIEGGSHQGVLLMLDQRVQDDSFKLLLNSAGQDPDAEEPAGQTATEPKPDIVSRESSSSIDELEAFDRMVREQAERDEAMGIQRHIYGGSTESALQLEELEVRSLR